MEVNDEEVLPEEVLGWILLRRANLPTASRLAVQASVGNSLRFDAIERALRDQEEELLAAERHHDRKVHGKGGGPKRTFWVEENKEWGLLDFEPDRDDVPVHWIGNQLPEEVYTAPLAKDNPSEPDDDSWWSPSNYWDGPSAWWSSEEWPWPETEFSPEEQAELDEVYAAYEDKVRTFVQARTLMKNKANNRGFFPTTKGKFGKGKGKTKYKSSSPPKSTPVLAAMSTSPSTTSSKGRQRPGQPEYTGCFICGSKEHSFQHCPRRKQGKPGAAHYIDVLMVENGSLDEEEIVAAWNVQPDDERCHAVIDCGATETVASLNALTAVMQKRSEKFGPEEVKVDPNVQKVFRFGNGKTLQSCSYVEIPQTIGGQKTWLGVHTLDTDDHYVPLLLGMRTLERLQASVDFGSKTATFSSVSPHPVRLQQCARSGHLIVDLTSDWLDASFDECYKERRGFEDPSETAAQQDVGAVDMSMEDVDEVHETAHAQTFVHERQATANPEVLLEESRLKVSFGLATSPQTASSDHVSQQAFLGMHYGGVFQEESYQDQVAGRRDLRLCSKGRSQREGPSVPWRSLPGTTQLSTDGQRLQERQEWLGPLEDMPDVWPSIGIYSRFRGHRKASECRPSWSRCEGPVEGEAQRVGQFFQGCAGQPHHCPRRCRTESCSASGSHSPTERNQGLQGCYLSDHGKEDHCRDQEGSQEGGRAEARGVGGEGGVSRLLESTDGLTATPPGVKSLIAENLEATATAIQACMREFKYLDEKFALNNHGSSLDLLEVCCPPNSALSDMVEKMGGKAARITEKNMNLMKPDGFEASQELGAR